MTDQAQTPANTQGQGDNPLQPVESKHRVVEVLGLIELKAGEGAEEDCVLDDNGAGNSTRWVFDVEAVREGKLVVQLVDMRGRNAESDIEPSFHITPLGAEFYEANVWGETDGTQITLHFSKACKFRVDADIIGTNRR